MEGSIRKDRSESTGSVYFPANYINKYFKQSLYKRSFRLIRNSKNTSSRLSFYTE